MPGAESYLGPSSRMQPSGASTGADDYQHSQHLLAGAEANGSIPPEPRYPGSGFITNVPPIITGYTSFAGLSGLDPTSLGMTVSAQTQASSAAKKPAPPPKRKILEKKELLEVPGYLMGVITEAPEAASPNNGEDAVDYQGCHFRYKSYDRRTRSKAHGRYVEIKGKGESPDHAFEVWGGYTENDSDRSFLIRIYSTEGYGGVVPEIHKGKRPKHELEWRKLPASIAATLTDEQVKQVIEARLQKVTSSWMPKEKGIYTRLSEALFHLFGKQLEAYLSIGKTHRARPRKINRTKV